jgi:hypothetical protein
MARAARTMAMAMMRAMATDSNNMGDGYGEEAGRQATDGVKDTAAHAMTGERGVMVAMGHGLCVFLCVWRDHKK